MTVSERMQVVFKICEEHGYNEQQTREQILFDWWNDECIEAIDTRAMLALRLSRKLKHDFKDIYSRIIK